MKNRLRNRVQVAALCWRRRKGKLEVLLVTSRETRRWVTPKGWPMQGLKDFNAARIEALEEAGVEGRVARKAVGHYRYAKRTPDGIIPVRVAVFGLQVKRIRKRWREQKQRKRNWFTPEAAALRVQEAELKSIIRALEA